MPNKTEIYVPSVARFPDDLKTRYDLLQIAREQGFQTGLMLVIGPNDLSAEGQQKQLDNLDLYAKLSPTERPKVFGMQPNMPLEGKDHFNFLDNPNQSQESVEKGIELIAHVPEELTPESGKALSFHLNTLIKPNQWNSDEEYWRKAFEDALRRIHDIAAYGKRNNVSLAVETVPIPEFGDVRPHEENLMDDGHTYWRNVGNP